MECSWFLLPDLLLPALLCSHMQEIPPASVPHMWLLLLWIQPVLKISLCSKEANTDTVLTVLAQQATQSYTACNCVSNPPLIICLSMAPVLLHSWPNLEFLILSEVISTLCEVIDIGNKVLLLQGSAFRRFHSTVFHISSAACPSHSNPSSLWNPAITLSTFYCFICCIQQFFMSNNNSWSTQLALSQGLGICPPTYLY